MNKVQPVDLELLLTLFQRTRGRVKYKLGGKAALDTDSVDIKQIDCSGFVRWALARSGFKIPDGSQAQREFFEKSDAHKLKLYSDVKYAKDDPSRLFIAFLSPKNGEEWPRHVWLVYMGRTMESCSSLGVDSRPWDTRALRYGHAAFEIPIKG